MLPYESRAVTALMIDYLFPKRELTKNSGEGGIRTLGSREGYNGFRDRPDRPLWHLSELQASIILELKWGVKRA
jgi:hypothetical protein